MKTLIAVPCFDMVHTDFMRSMVELQKPDDTSFTVMKNTLVHISRNIVAANAIEYGFDRVMWFDSDMVFKPDALIRLSEAMDSLNADLVSGLYFTRRLPNIKPVAYGRMWYTEKDGEIDTGAENLLDYPASAVVSVDAVGFGCCLTSVDLLKRVADKFGAPFNHLPTMGEDMAFCWRAQQVGATLWLDTTVKCGHIGTCEINEETYKSLHPNAP